MTQHTGQGILRSMYYHLSI